MRMSFEEFEERVKNATDGKISVVRESYQGTMHPVTAYCNIHKIYFQCPRAKRLYDKNKNCPECAKESCHDKQIKPWSEVLKSFIDAYGNKFSYDESTYNGTKKPMKVHCNNCGEDFEITPAHHLKYNNGGCPNCHLTKLIKCSGCGKNVYVDRRTSVDSEHYICDECHRKHRHKRNSDIKQFKYCKICGRCLDKHNKCENDFCN